MPPLAANTFASRPYRAAAAAAANTAMVLLLQACA